MIERLMGEIFKTCEAQMDAMNYSWTGSDFEINPRTIYQPLALPGIS